MRPETNLLWLLLVGSSTMISVSGSDLSTLFTTPQERQLINANRYQPDAAKPLVATTETAFTAQSIQPLVQQEVRETITITAITLSNNGPNRVWINSQVYQDGDSTDDKMHIKVISGNKVKAGNEVKVRITAPDGEHYYATSGETLEISYQAVVEN